MKRPASQIRLLDIYLAMEDREIFVFYDAARDSMRGVGRYVSIGLVEPLNLAREAMERELANTTIQDIVDDITRQESQISAAE